MNRSHVMHGMQIDRLTFLLFSLRSIDVVLGDIRFILYEITRHASMLVLDVVGGSVPCEDLLAAIAAPAIRTTNDDNQYRREPIR